MQISAKEIDLVPSASTLTSVRGLSGRSWANGGLQDLLLRDDSPAESAWRSVQVLVRLALDS